MGAVGLAVLIVAALLGLVAAFAAAVAISAKVNKLGSSIEQGPPA